MKLVLCRSASGNLNIKVRGGNNNSVNLIPGRYLPCCAVVSLVKAFYQKCMPAMLVIQMRQLCQRCFNDKTGQNFGG